MAVFGRSTLAQAPLGEQRSLSFISPVIGAHTEALTDYATSTPEGALRVPAVWSCTHLLADAMTILKPRVYRQVGNELVELPPPPIMTNPSADTTIDEYVFMDMISRQLRGNTFGKILDFDQGGYPAQIELQHPDLVGVRRNQNGVMEIRFKGVLQKPEEVWHKRAFPMPGAKLGLSPITMMAQTIQGPAFAERFGVQWFQDGAHPSGILTNPSVKDTDPAGARKVKERFMAALHGTREPVVMTGGWEYKSIQVAAAESQFLEAQKWGVSQICRIFRVPPEMIGGAADGTSLTYANVEDRSLAFLVYSLQPWITRFEASYSSLLPRGQVVKFDTSELLRTDIITRFLSYHMGIAGRFITPEEARRGEGLPPLTPEQQAELDKVNTAPPAITIPGPKKGT